VRLDENIISRINFISDTVLYPEATGFFDHCRPPDNSQLNGLVVYAGGKGNLDSYIGHQKSRDWTGKKEYYKEFYTRLDGFLKKLKKRIKDEFKLIPEDLNKNEEKLVTSEILFLLAQEFVQHLVCEGMLRNARKS
jgi:hypothetical protein